MVLLKQGCKAYSMEIFARQCKALQCRALKDFLRKLLNLKILVPSFDPSAKMLVISSREEGIKTTQLKTAISDIFWGGASLLRG